MPTFAGSSGRSAMQGQRRSLSVELLTPLTKGNATQRTLRRAVSAPGLILKQTATEASFTKEAVKLSKKNMQATMQFIGQRKAQAAKSRGTSQVCGMVRQVKVAGESASTKSGSQIVRRNMHTNNGSTSSNTSAIAKIGGLAALALGTGAAITWLGLKGSDHPEIEIDIEAAAQRCQKPAQRETPQIEKSFTERTLTDRSIVILVGGTSRLASEIIAHQLSRGENAEVVITTRQDSAKVLERAKKSEFITQAIEEGKFHVVHVGDYNNVDKIQQQFDEIVTKGDGKKIEELVLINLAGSARAPEGQTLDDVNLLPLTKTAEAMLGTTQKIAEDELFAKSRLGFVNLSSIAASDLNPDIDEYAASRQRADQAALDLANRARKMFPDKEKIEAINGGALRPGMILDPYTGAGSHRYGPDWWGTVTGTAGYTPIPGTGKFSFPIVGAKDLAEALINLGAQGDELRVVTDAVNNDDIQLIDLFQFFADLSGRKAGLLKNAASQIGLPVAEPKGGKDTMKPVHIPHGLAIAMAKEFQSGRMQLYAVRLAQARDSQHYVVKHDGEFAALLRKNPEGIWNMYLDESKEDEPKRMVIQENFSNTLGAEFMEKINSDPASINRMAKAALPWLPTLMAELAF